MATASSVDFPPLPPEWNDTPEQWRQELKQNAANMWLADKGLGIDRVQKTPLVAQALMKFAATADKDQLAKDLALVNAETDEMGVNIGNKEYHVHYETPQSTPQQPPSAPPVASPQASGATNTLGKVAAGALLAGSGGLATIGALMGWNYLTKPAPHVPAPPAVEFKNTDTNAGLRFKE